MAMTEKQRAAYIWHRECVMRTNAAGAIGDMAARDDDQKREELAAFHALMESYGLERAAGDIGGPGMPECATCTRHGWIQSVSRLADGRFTCYRCRDFIPKAPTPPHSAPQPPTMPPCPMCGHNKEVTPSIHSTYGTHYCLVHGWFTPAPTPPPAASVPAPTPTPPQTAGTQQEAASGPVDPVLRHELMDRCQMLHEAFVDYIMDRSPEGALYPPEVTKAVEAASDAMYAACAALSKWEDDCGAPGPITVPREMAEGFVGSFTGLPRTGHLAILYGHLRAQL